MTRALYGQVLVVASSDSSVDNIVHTPGVMGHTSQLFLGKCQHIEHLTQGNKQAFVKSA
jgi:hypothetical protein